MNDVILIPLGNERCLVFAMPDMLADRTVRIVPSPSRDGESDRPSETLRTLRFGVGFCNEPSK